MALIFPVWQLVVAQYRGDLAAAIGPGVDIDVVDDQLEVRLPTSRRFQRSAWAATATMARLWGELTMGADVALVVHGGRRRVRSDPATMHAVAGGAPFDTWAARAAWSISASRR